MRELFAPSKSHKPSECSQRDLSRRHKDRENISEFKAFDAGPHTAPLDHLEQTQHLVSHVKMVSTSLSAGAQKLEQVINWI